MSLSQATFEGVEPTTQDPFEIGWYIESADEDIYGPVSRKSLHQFLDDGTISPNTLVRHCTQPESRPAADQPALGEPSGAQAKAAPIDDDGGLYDPEHDAPAGLVPPGKIVGDRLDEAWPRKKKDQQALAEGTLPCPPQRTSPWRRIGA